MDKISGTHARADMHQHDVDHTLPPTQYQLGETLPRLTNEEVVVRSNPRRNHTFFFFFF
jgi:hypothetical protein